MNEIINEIHKNINKSNNNRNFQKEMDRLIEKNQRKGIIPTLFLHSCCAPCSSYVLEYLSQYFKITVYYYNPNIYPPEEYEERTMEVERLIRELPAKYPISFISGEYRPELFYEAVKGHEGDKEGGERCSICFSLRLEEAARLAKEGNVDYFTTTLTISTLKNAARLNQIGEEMGEKYGVSYLDSDFKKKNVYKRSTELSKKYNLYRQDYCGCVFSMRERQTKK